MDSEVRDSTVCQAAWLCFLEHSRQRGREQRSERRKQLSHKEMGCLDEMSGLPLEGDGPRA